MSLPTRRRLGQPALAVDVFRWPVSRARVGRMTGRCLTGRRVGPRRKAPPAGERGRGHQAYQSPGDARGGWRGLIAYIEGGGPAINSHHIQYQSYHAGPKDAGGTTALHDTPERAPARAESGKYADENTWASGLFTGLVGTVLRAEEPLWYTDCKRTPVRKCIAAGQTFVAGDITAAGLQVTRAGIGNRIVDREGGGRGAETTGRNKRRPARGNA
jgi:hypothetical protein